MPTAQKSESTFRVPSGSRISCLLVLRFGFSGLSKDVGSLVYVLGGGCSGRLYAYLVLGLESLGRRGLALSFRR